MRNIVAKLWSQESSFYRWRRRKDVIEEKATKFQRKLANLREPECIGHVCWKDLSDLLLCGDWNARWPFPFSPHCLRPFVDTPGKWTAMRVCCLSLFMSLSLSLSPLFFAFSFSVSMLFVIFALSYEIGSNVYCESWWCI